MKFCVVLLALLSFSVAARAISFAVDAHKEECFYEMVEDKTQVGISFQVTSGGFLDIDAKILGPDDRVIYQVEREAEGKYSFNSYMAGTYRVCFSNRMSTLTPKTVVLTMNIGSTRVDSSDVLKEGDISPLENTVRRISDQLSQIQGEINLSKNREARHRNTSESTNARVLWWSFSEAVILVVLSLWQIYYVRRFFDRPSKPRV